jgi:hypothetical protein
VSSQASASAGVASRADPARARGLRRARRLAPCAPVASTPLPAAPTDVELLALLTRARSVRVARGELASTRLYDLRAFKTVAAELAYLRRLAAGGRYEGTVVTSMRQLVVGLAPLHPAWRMTGGEGWEDRDRHHQAVRRRLRALQAMGLVRWSVGVDEDGEERRTELELLSVPEVMPAELAAAAARLARWEARYGAELDTGSRTGIRGVRRASAPLSASERQRRGCARVRDRAARRGVVESSKSNSTPPCGAEPTAQNNGLFHEDIATTRNRCERTGVTRANAPVIATDTAAVNGSKTTCIEDGGPFGSDGSPVSETTGDLGIDVQALLARVRQRQALRAPILAEIAAQANRRAVEVCQWSLERQWPAGRLREAWVVARFGARAAAEGGSHQAGPLARESYERLRRAVARYERSADARPEGFPARGLGALLHLGGVAGEAGPRTLAYAIGALDQLSRRMRAHATAASLERVQAAERRARKRHLDPPPPPPFQFRSAGPRWPKWLTVDEAGVPVFSAGLPVIDVELAEGMGAHPSSGYYDATIRDAYLVAGQDLPTLLDGRWAMRLRDSGEIPPAGRRDTGDWNLLELVRRTGEPAARWARVPPVLRDEMLACLRADEARQARAELDAFHDRHNDTRRPAP